MTEDEAKKHFIERVLLGYVLDPDESDTDWRNIGDTLARLGMTWGEYRTFAEEPSFHRSTLMAGRHRIPVRLERRELSGDWQWSSCSGVGTERIEPTTEDNQLVLDALWM